MYHVYIAMPEQFFLRGVWGWRELIHSKGERTAAASTPMRLRARL
jgi:hypothetical protein